jgi:hypothetical protein
VRKAILPRIRPRSPARFLLKILDGEKRSGVVSTDWRRREEQADAVKGCFGGRAVAPRRLSAQISGQFSGVGFSKPLGTKGVAGAEPGSWTEEKSLHGR